MAETKDATRGRRREPPDVSEKTRKEVSSVTASEENFQKTIEEEAERARSPPQPRSETLLLVPPEMTARRLPRPKCFLKKARCSGRWRRCAACARSSLAARTSLSTYRTTTKTTKNERHRATACPMPSPRSCNILLSARQVLSSRGNPTVQLGLSTGKRVFALLYLLELDCFV